MRKGKAPCSVEHTAPYEPPDNVEMVVGHAYDPRSRPGATNGGRDLGMRPSRPLCRPKSALVGHGGNVQSSRGIVATPARRDYSNAMVIYLGEGREHIFGEQRAERAFDQRNSTGSFWRKRPRRKKWETKRRRAR